MMTVSLTGPTPRRVPGAGAAALLAGALAAAASVWPVGRALAGQADVVAAEAGRDGDGRYRLEVSVRHADEGWDHYADRWEVLAPDGTVLGVRELLHPHVGEQPFTRGLGAVAVPEGIGRVRVRARDSVHGYGGREVELGLPGR